jgi:hypothetical protein
MYTSATVAASHSDFVIAQLHATEQRIEEAADALAASELEPAWLSTCAEREMAIQATVDADSMPTTWLQARLGLSATECRVLWILIAHELSPRARARLRDLNTEQLSDVTLDTLRRVVFGSRPDSRAWQELGPSGSLRRRYLIEPVEDESGPEHRNTFKVARRVLALVHGVVALDEELTGVAELPADAPGADDLEIDPAIRAQVRATIALRDGMCLLQGRSGSGRRSLLVSLAREAAMAPLAVDARKLATERDLAQRQLRIIARECQLLRQIPVVLHLDGLDASNQVADRLDLFEVEVEVEGVVLATTTRRIARRWRSAPTVFEIPTLTNRQRSKLWERTLPMASTGDAELLATMYPLAPALIQAVARIAIKRANGS